jgi:hypothetical protein
MKNDYRTSCQHYTYKNNDRITLIRNDGESVIIGLLTFEWKDDKMVKATTSETEESDYYFERRIENIYEKMDCS